MFYILCSSSAIIIYNAFIAFLVYKDSKHKGINFNRMWALISLLFPFIGAITYICLTSKRGRRSSKKSIVAFIVATIIFAALATGIYFVADYISENDKNSFPDEELTYELGDDEVVYDKMGKSYTYEQWDKFLYYDKDGNAYYLESRADDDSAYTKEGYRNAQTGEYISTDFLEKGSSTDLINEEGYIVFFRDNLYTDDNINIYLDDKNPSDVVYYDNNGKLYYTTGSVCWDDKGNMQFKEDFLYKDYTYEMIKELAEASFQD